MGLYADRLLPHVVDLACGAASTRPLRRRVCAGLRGSVVELGFGTGHNVPYYPSAVTLVDAVEPSDRCWSLAGERLTSSTVEVRRSALDGQRLPFVADSHDCALSTWTLCTIPDAPAALAELRRVLRPGGRLHFVEHGRAFEESVRRRQRRIEPVSKRLLGGCHLSRPIARMVTGAGFELETVEEFYDPSTPKVFGAYVLGVAVSPG